jgi:glycosyltransferase involved in cell wall biosynthesis
MKILIVNYRFFVSGGPERYMFGLFDLLRQAGQEVVPFSIRYKQNRPSQWDDYFVSPIAGDGEVYFTQHSWTVRTVRKSLERAFYSNETYDALSRLVQVERPDVALVLHYLRKLSPSVLTSLRDNGVPIIVRLSDFGMVCPEQHLLRDGHVCEDCIGTHLWPSVRHRCVQGSFGTSLVNALAMGNARARHYFDAIDRFIAPSSIMREKMLQAGYEAHRVVHLPTFVSWQPSAKVERSRRICYVGRIEPTKGVDVLIEGFDNLARQAGFDDLELLIVGDDSTVEAQRLKDHIESRGLRRVVFAGERDRAEVMRLLSSALVSVIPSTSCENLPNSLLESLACGTPIVGSRVSSIVEALQDTGAGALFRSGDPADLSRVLANVLKDERRLADMSAAARSLATERYDPTSHLSALLHLFREVLSQARAGGR